MTGDSNTAVGTGALQSSAGNGNTPVGAGAGAGVSIGNNVICIGAQGANVDNSCYVGNIFGATSSGGVAVLVNADGKLATTPSSRRFKEEITRMDQASEAIFALEPVTFRYKEEIDSTAASQFGLVAEDVEKVNRDLVVRDKEGKAYSVRYDQVNAMLLNEFLKEHKAFLEEQRKVQEQESVIAQQRKDLELSIAELKKEMETIVARLKEHDSRIQKATDQIGARNPAAQLVLKDR